MFVDDKNIEKLHDISLANISGGDPNYMYYHNRMLIGCIVGAVGTVGLMGCSIASTVYKIQAYKATKAGNITKGAKLSKTAQSLGIAAAVFALPTIGGFATAAVFQHKKPQMPTPGSNNFKDPGSGDPLCAEEEANEA